MKHWDEIQVIHELTHRVHFRGNTLVMPMYAERERVTSVDGIALVAFDHKSSPEMCYSIVKVPS